MTVRIDHRRDGELWITFSMEKSEARGTPLPIFKPERGYARTLEVPAAATLADFLAAVLREEANEGRST